MRLSSRFEARESLLRAAGIAIGISITALLATSCQETGGPLPAIEAPPAPERPSSPEAPKQFQIVRPAEPGGEITPLPEPPQRVAVVVEEQVDGARKGEDSMAEGILAEAVQAEKSTAPGLGWDISSRQVYERVLARETTGLRLRDGTLDAEVLRNLAETGVDLLLLGELEVVTGEPPPVPAGQAAAPAVRREASVAALVSLVKADDATLLATGTHSVPGSASFESKKSALGGCLRQVLRSYRALQASPVKPVLLTVEGLRDERDAASLEKALRSRKGVAWLKPARFEQGAQDKPSSVGRFELGWSGDPEELKGILRDIQPGFRLQGTFIEGNRWSFRAADFAPAAGNAAREKQAEAKPAEPKLPEAKPVEPKPAEGGAP